MITIAQMVRRLNISLVTVNNWRQGSKQRAPLPMCVKQLGRSRRLYIHEADVIEWLKANRPDLVSKWQTNKSAQTH